MNVRWTKRGCLWISRYG